MAQTLGQPERPVRTYQPRCTKFVRIHVQAHSLQGDVCASKLTCMSVCIHVLMYACPYVCMSYVHMQGIPLSGTLQDLGATNVTIRGYVGAEGGGVQW